MRVSQWAIVTSLLLASCEPSTVDNCDEYPDYSGDDTITGTTDNDTIDANIGDDTGKDTIRMALRL